MYIDLWEIVAHTPIVFNDYFNTFNEIHVDSDYYLTLAQQKLPAMPIFTSLAKELHERTFIHTQKPFIVHTVNRETNSIAFMYYL